jgi:hypothetical protein
MKHLTVNFAGQARGSRFRKHFGLTLEGASAYDYDWALVHDYLHAYLGARPDEAGEERVLAFQQDVYSGIVPLPRGLSWE